MEIWKKKFIKETKPKNNWLVESVIWIWKYWLIRLVWVHLSSNFIWDPKCVGLLNGSCHFGQNKLVYITFYSPKSFPNIHLYSLFYLVDKKKIILNSKFISKINISFVENELIVLRPEHYVHFMCLYPTANARSGGSLPFLAMMTSYLATCWIYLRIFPVLWMTIVCH